MNSPPLLRITLRPRLARLAWAAGARRSHKPDQVTTMNGYTPRRRPGLVLSLELVGCAAGGLLGVIATAFVHSGSLASGALGISGAGIGVIAGGLVAIRIEDD